MAIPVTGRLFKAYADKMIEAIERIPEDKRDFVIWSGGFKGADGKEQQLSAQTPVRLAADVIVGLTFMGRALQGAAKFEPEDFAKASEETDELAKKPLSEIAALGRKSADQAAALIDALTEADLKGEVPGPGGGFPKSAIALALLTHLTHHRGQLHTILRAVGVEPPAFL